MTFQLTAEQFQSLLEALGNDICWRTILLLAGSFGLRISEVLGLKWSDVDWLGKTVRIERGVVKQIVDTLMCGQCRPAVETSRVRLV